MSPLVSFLTSAYNTERYVGETIESVLAQTRADWELIVVDNGNSDEMARVVGRYTADPRIKLVRQENKGLRGGVTAAADVATGRYLCTLHSDDMVQPDYCKQVGTLIDADPGVQAVGCDAELFADPDDGSPPGRYFESIGSRSVPDPSRVVSLEEMLEDGVPCYVGAFRRDVWEAHNAFNPSSPDVEADVEMWVSLAAAGRDIRVLPERLARIRVRPDSLSHDPEGIEEFERKLQQAFLTACKSAAVSEGMVSASGMMRRLRYHQAMRRARWALLEDDVRGARAAAGDAFRQRRTVRAGAVFVALAMCPGLLRSIHPAKNRVQSVLHRARFRVVRRHAR